MGNVVGKFFGAMKSQFRNFFEEDAFEFYVKKSKKGCRKFNGFMRF